MSREINMTQGGIFRHLLKFSIPLLAGNLFQQFYNMTDLWVVGNYVSDVAFSAVGTVSSVINMLIGAFTGLSSGVGVVISQYYGAKNDQKVQEAVHTAIAMTAVLAVLLSVLGVCLTPVLLRLMKVPEEVFPQSRTYLTIYFSGLAGLMFYNMTAGILRAIGDSYRPFYYLVVCAGLNVILDLFFVLKLGMGVEGVAYATIIAQGISAIIGVRTLLLSHSCVQLIPRRIRCHWEMLRQITSIGLPTAVQMTVTAFSGVFAQSYINVFGSDCMGGWTAYMKVDQLILLPTQSLSVAAMTFAGQNLGRLQVERARKGVRAAFTISAGVTVAVTILVVAGAPLIVAVLNDKNEVIQYGTLFLRTLTPFYIFGCIFQIYAGGLRGAGNSKAPMVILLSCAVAFRQMYFYVVSHFITEKLLPIILGYPVSWGLCALVMVVAYRRMDLEKYALIQKTEVESKEADRSE